jgi:hypothetical protein
MSADMLVHRQVKQYGNIRPKYSDIKRMIIHDLSSGKNQPPFLIKSVSFSKS